jgi:hypothetical protein
MAHRSLFQAAAAPAGIIAARVSAAHPEARPVPDRARYSAAEASPSGKTAFRGGRRLLLTALGALAILAFGLAYGQSPLYTSNQNQYFLHGAARAGLGFLGEDWLANTVDPAPVFSWIVEGTFRFLPPAAFYLEYLGLAGVYLIGLWLLADSLFDLRSSAARSLLFLALVVVLHSAALRLVQGRLLGEAWEYLWDGGVAGQRLLGSVLQPSVFGVLLLLSLGLFARRREAWACAAAALAACVHPTYLLPAGILVLTYCLVLWQEERSLRRPVVIGLLALALVVPIVLYVVLILGPTSSESFAQAQQILVEERVPHHALPAEWFDATVVVKLLLVGMALIAARGARLARVLALATAAAVLLTGVQIWTRDNTLALLFPWRISTVLVPAAVGLLCGWLARRATAPERAAPRCIVAVGCTAVLILLALAGVFASRLQRAELDAHPASGVFGYVRQHVRSGEVYLIPSSLQEFRLATGAPAFVDRKAIPYPDIDVIEWRERLRLVNRVYREEPSNVNCELLDMLAEGYGVTHVVLDEDLLDLACPQARPVYRDAHYAVHVLIQP